MAARDCVRVAVRIRPFNKRERDAGSRCIVSVNGNTVSIQDPRCQQQRRCFTFDSVFWSHSGFVKNREGLIVPEEEGGRYADQACVFAGVGQGIVGNALQGYNATLLAYGQTGSGKSYSMMGFGVNKGLVPNLCRSLFTFITANQDKRQCQILFSMLEIYNEQVIDLLSRSARPPGGLRVREDQRRGFYVEGLRRVACESAVQAEQLMEQGTRTRTTASTHLNASSSRSHMLIIIQLKQVFCKECVTKESNMNLVDLAGSERQRSSGSEVDRLKEGTAINLSLTTLGNVISALADLALGKRSVYVPYRDSVLTKLLQPALGGNSRTVMVATLSPADICYEESLSTLRYAERAKRIQNKAVVNEGATERLLKELKAENTKLLLKLSKLDQEGLQAHQETKDLRCLLNHNELQIRAIQTLWEQHLQDALKDWETQYTNITQERRMMQLYPYLQNINEDSQLSGVIKLFIQEGDWDVGLADSPRSISIRGLGIQDKHAVFSNQQRRVTVTPVSKSKLIINGASKTQTTELQHLDRVILGSSSTFLFIGFPSDRVVDDWSRYDYDYFQSELAAAEGIHLQTLCDPRAQRTPQPPNPSLLAAFYDYIKLMPRVAEANQMSQELKKGVEFKLEIKNLAMSDSKGHDLEKEIVVRVTNEQNKQVWLWSKAKFINRKFLMEEVYQLGASLPASPRDTDPFWDPVEPLHLGSAHLWLHSLAFRMAVDEQLEVVGPQGTEEAMLHARLEPCSPTGLPLGEDDILIDPTELVGKRLDFRLTLDQCCGLRWVKEDQRRGVQIRFQMFDCAEPLCTPDVWHCVNPQLCYSVQFTAMNTSDSLLSYLQSNAVVLQLWGLQEGCADTESSDHGAKKSPPNSTLIDTAAERHLEALAASLPSDPSARLRLDLERLKTTNAALKKENNALREELSAHTRHECVRARRPSRSSIKSGCDAEFARALKAFYHGMTSVRAQLQRLRRHRPSEEADLLALRLFVDEHTHLLKEFSEQLERCVCTLKQDVAAIVRTKREKAAAWN